MHHEFDDAKLKQALTDPASVFPDPMAVVKAPLPDARKIEILRRWEYDAREMQVMEEESLPAGESAGSTLDSVLEALRSLGAGDDSEQAPPTKQ